MKNRTNRWAWPVMALAAAWFVLAGYRGMVAAPQRGQQPFANSVQQRAAMIQELQQIRQLLEEQNRLLKKKS